MADTTPATPQVATPAYGKHKILMFRLYEDRLKAGATKLALQTKHEWKYEAKSDSTETKDGTINSPATPGVTLDIEAISSLDDVNTMLKNSVIDQKMLEVWEINLGDPQDDGKYGAVYARGYMTSWDVPSEVGKLDELKTSMNIDQIPQDGVATVSDEQAKAIQYAFEDTIKAVDPTPTA